MATEKENEQDVFNTIWKTYVDNARPLCINSKSGHPNYIYAVELPDGTSDYTLSFTGFLHYIHYGGTNLEVLFDFETYDISELVQIYGVSVFFLSALETVHDRAVSQCSIKSKSTGEYRLRTNSSPRYIKDALSSFAKAQNLNVPVSTPSGTQTGRTDVSALPKELKNSGWPAGGLNKPGWCPPYDLDRRNP